MGQLRIRQQYSFCLSRITTILLGPNVPYYVETGLWSFVHVGTRETYVQSRLGLYVHTCSSSSGSGSASSSSSSRSLRSGRVRGRGRSGSSCSGSIGSGGGNNNSISNGCGSSSVLTGIFKGEAGVK